MSGHGTSCTSTPEVERPSVSSYQVFNFVANILVIIVLLVLFVVFESVLEPFKRGFFCDDESIAKPYRTKETISAVLLTVLAIIFIFLVIIVCDTLNKSCFGNKVRHLDEDNPIANRCCFKPWIYRMFARIVFAMVGLSLCMIIIGVMKIMVGRLRPHFLDVCKPTITKCVPGMFYDLSNCSAPDAKAFKEARKSFPSGHAGCSAYASVFFVLYVEYAIRPVLLSLIKPLVQLLVLLGGIAISLTRISDYFHHWSDVFGGFIIGALVAYYAIHRLLELPTDFPSTRTRAGSTQNGRQPIYGSSLDVEQNYKSQAESVLTT